MSMQNMRRPKAIVAGLVILLAAGLTAWKVYAGRQPRLDAAGEKLVSFVASDQFKQLPADQQKQYAESMLKHGNLVLKDDNPGPEQEKAIRNMATVQMQGMLGDYFKLPEGKSRKDFLDRMIDQQEQIKKMMENPPTTQPGEGQRIVMKKTGGSSASAQKAMAETVPPDQQAKLAQFKKDMQARRAERGLPEGPSGIMIIRSNTTSVPK